MIEIKTFLLKNVQIYLSEAFLDGKQIAFTSGNTAYEAEKKLKEKLENYYHFTLKQNGQKQNDQTRILGR